MTTNAALWWCTLHSALQQSGKDSWREREGWLVMQRTPASWWANSEALSVAWKLRDVVGAA